MLRKAWPFFVLLLVFLGACTPPPNAVADFREDAVFAMGENQFEAFLADSTHFSQDSLPFRPERKLSPQKGNEDLMILCRIIQTHATTRNRFKDQAQWDELIQEVWQKSRQPMSYIEIFREAARLIAFLGEAHSSVGHSGDYRRWRSNFMEILPLDFYLDGQAVHLKADFRPKDQLRTGLEVAMLNGVRMGTVIQNLAPFIPADGNQDLFAKTVAVEHFANAYPNFIENPDSFVFKFKTSEGLVTKTVEKLSRKELQKQLGSRRAPSTPPLPLRFSYNKEDDYGLLKITSFNKEYLRARGQDFEQFIDSAFTALHHLETENLILDLQGNNGGWTGNGKYLCGYLSSDTLPFIERVFTRKGPEINFQPLLTSEIPWKDTMNLREFGDGGLNWENYPNHTVIPAAQHGFKGKLIVLTDLGSQSCSAVVTHFLRTFTSAIVVGRPYGGAGVGTGGMTVSFRLPHTGIGVTMSTAQYNFPKPRAGSNKPDVWVHNSYEEAVEEKDMILKKAVEQLRPPINNLP